MRFLLVLMGSIFATIAVAQDQPRLTVEQCITVLSGLKTLDWQGKQIGEDVSKRPADAKQYKLGDARYTIALDIAALDPILTSYQRAQQQFIAELPAIPPTPEGKTPTTEILQMQAEQNKKSIANQIAMLAKPCTVMPGHLKLSEMKLGDDAEHNAIPPSAFAAFSLIVDKDK